MVSDPAWKSSKKARDRSVAEELYRLSICYDSQLWMSEELTLNQRKGTKVALKHAMDIGQSFELMDESGNIVLIGPDILSKSFAVFEKIDLSG